MARTIISRFPGNSKILAYLKMYKNYRSLAGLIKAKYCSSDYEREECRPEGVFLDKKKESLTKGFSCCIIITTSEET
jgi:hypothetical protein